jgi:hypothetical protein
MPFYFGFLLTDLDDPRHEQVLPIADGRMAHVIAFAFVCRPQSLRLLLYAAPSHCVRVCMPHQVICALLSASQSPTSTTRDTSRSGGVRSRKGKSPRIDWVKVTQTLD